MEGIGLVAYNRRTMAMELNGIDAGGNDITVKLGRYFWMWACYTWQDWLELLKQAKQNWDCCLGL